ncbi:ATP-dependent RNA helicase dbp6 [Massospora cicadina]|nr:ATP-dependent RNA helicase dbp6 [Massospora cicadina]
MFKVDRYEGEGTDDEVVENQPIPISQLARAKVNQLNLKPPHPQVGLPSKKRLKFACAEVPVEAEEGLVELKVIPLESHPTHTQTLTESESSETGEPDSHSTLPSPEADDPNPSDNGREGSGYLPVFQPLNGDAEAEARHTEFKRSKLGLPGWLANPVVVGSQDTLTVNEVGGCKFLSPQLIRRCENLNITELFAVQKAVIPLLARPELASERFPPGDLCVSAPTGSGKTLAYVLPIVQRLHTRTVPRLRALVIVPTRDLMTQVKETFTFFCAGTDLKVGAFNKNASLLKERQQLVGNLKDMLMGGSTLVDILVTTPGRLMDHLKGTPNFSLQHLQFMVIDEADRLLSDNFSDWLPKVLEVIEREPEFPPVRRPGVNAAYRPLSLGGHGPVGVPTLSHDAVNREITPPDPLYAFSHSAPQVQKLLFSATLTRNPGKIAALKLRHPTYIKVQGSEGGASRYATPSSLVESYLVGPNLYKPLLLLYLLTKYRITSALVFTKSVEASVRLNHFVNVYRKRVGRELSNPTSDPNQASIQNTDLGQAEVSPDAFLSTLKAANFSSDLERSERQAILKQFKAGKVQILICSDLVARGLDVEGVEMVINYDTPHHIKQYIHRVGRTARAGQSGRAITLLTPSEVTPFRQMQDKADRRRLVRQEHLQKTKLDAWMPYYEASLREVEDLLRQKD